MTTEKICFRYDGSKEAKQGVFIKCLNKENISIGNFITSDGWIFINQPTTYRLVTPAEFLRLVKGQSEPKWKVGDECMIDDCKITYQILSIVNGYAWLYSDEGHITAKIEALRPIRKSVKYELVEILCGSYNATEKAQEILSKFNLTPKS